MPRSRPNFRPKRDEILTYIANYADSHSGNSPSLSEIAAKFHISRQSVYAHTLKLAAEQRIEWRDGKLCIISYD